ncbi:MAG: hypothetical protein AMK72_00615 [Planctomycetes bacterium SM23_25]|nr:MAG: hypothetical protein AMK72_00615 [Planctomycetes bacterium SM23_25]
MLWAAAFGKGVCSMNDRKYGLGLLKLARDDLAALGAMIGSPAFPRLMGVRFAWTPRQTCASKPYEVKDLP